MPAPHPEGPNHENPLARERWFRRGRIVAGKPGAAARLLRRAYQQKMTLRAAHLKARTAAGTNSYSTYSASITTNAANSYGGWVPLGPAPINSNATGSLEEQDYGPVVGRATSVVADPGDPTGNTVYLGGAYGGLWKSTNAAASDPSTVTWTPLIEQQATLAVGSVAVQPSSNGPSSVVLVGTGEADFSIDSYYGLGILRSADGGNTWTLISADNQSHQFSGLAFAKIAFSADNPNLVVAAATGAGNDEGASYTGNTPGLYVSSDAGQTWTLALSGLSPVGASSVIYDSVGHKFFAFMQFEGYYTSTNGMNWHRLASQPGSALQSCPMGNTGFPVCYVFRGEIAAVPGREEVYAWYVTIDNNGNIGDGGIYKSTNGGGSWQQVNDSGITNCGDGSGNGCGVEQGWFNLTLAAVPDGTGTDLYAGAVNLYKCSITASNSLCGVKPFINLTHVYGCSPLGSLSHVHPDQHGISFVRASASQVVMYFANDGGIYRALNGYALKSGTCGTAPNPFQNLNGTMGSMAEFVDFSNSPTDPDILVGGTQDNGSPATDVNHGTSWISVNGGDGGFNAIDPASGNWFTSNTDVSVQRCGAGINCLAQTFDPVVTNSTVGGDHGFFYTPFILDPQATGRMMVGTCRLWRGNSDGSGFTPLSYSFEDLLPQACTGNEIQLARSIAAGGPVTPNGSSVIYVGTEGGYTPDGNQGIPGQIWVTNNADLGPFAWVNAIMPMFSAYPISSLAVDPGDPTGNTAYATIMGFGSPHVLQTTDQGLSWNMFGSQLPNAPINAIVVDPDETDIVYVGTDEGVYTSNDLQNWTELGQLPNVAVTQLQMFESGGVKQLRAGTYGRGIWSYDIPYQIKITTPQVYLLPGQTGAIQGVIFGYNGYSSPVTIACPATVSFGTCTSATVTPMPSGTPFSVSVTAGKALQSSKFALQGTGTDPNATAETSAAVNVTVTDYSFSLQPWNSLSVNQGITSGSVSLDTTSPSGFYEPITFSCSNLPAGASCNFFPAAVLPAFGSVVEMSISADANTPVGTYTVLVNGTVPDQASAKTAKLSLSVGSKPDFYITATTPAGPITVGGSTTSQVTVWPVRGYSGSVDLTCGTPEWFITCSLGSSSNVSVLVSGAPVSLTATMSVPTYNANYKVAGSFFVSFASGLGTASREAIVPLTVVDFGITAHNSNAAAFAGQAAQYELFVNPAGGSFPNPVSLSCTGLPAGSSCSFSPATVTPNGSQTIVVLTVSTAKQTAVLEPAGEIQAQLMLALLVPGVVLGMSAGARGKKACWTLLLVLLLLGIFLQPGCGGGGSSSVAPPPPPPPPPTPSPPSAPPPPVSYGFTATATSGTVQHQINLLLTVYQQ